MFSVDEDVRHESEELFQALTRNEKPSKQLTDSGATTIAPASGAKSPRKLNASGGAGKTRTERMDRITSKRFVLGIYEQYKTQQKSGEGATIDPIEVLLSKLADYLNGILPTPDIVVATIKNIETQAAKNPKNDKLLREMAGVQLLVSMIPEFETHIEIVNQTLTTLHMLVRLNPRNILAVSDVDIAVEEFIKWYRFCCCFCLPLFFYSLRSQIKTRECACGRF